MTSTGHLYGAGIYAEVYCVGSSTYNVGTANTAGAKVANVATLPSNCAAITKINTPQTPYIATGV